MWASTFPASGTPMPEETIENSCLEEEEEDLFRLDLHNIAYSKDEFSRLRKCHNYYCLSLKYHYSKLKNRFGLTLIKKCICFNGALKEEKCNVSSVRTQDFYISKTVTDSLRHCVISTDMLFRTYSRFIPGLTGFNFY